MSNDQQVLEEINKWLDHFENETIEMINDPGILQIDKLFFLINNYLILEEILKIFIRHIKTDS